MYRLAAFLLAILLAPGLAHAQPTPTVDTDLKADTIDPTMKPLRAHFGGRWLQNTLMKRDPVTYRKNGAIKLYSLPYYSQTWPGGYIESAFAGTDAYINIYAPNSHYHLIVDGQLAKDITQPPYGQVEYHIGNLAAGSHTLRLESLNERGGMDASTTSFFIPRHEKALPAPARLRQIEIIGDSYAAGYGTVSPKHECTPEEIRATTDTQIAFGPLVARHFDADYQVNAVSGIGMVRNYGNDPAPVMTALYPSTSLWNKNEKLSDKTWQPQIIVVALGDNDFATPVAAGEKWANDDALRDDFISTYITFVEDLHKQHPKTGFILMDFNEPNLPSYIDTIIDRLKSDGLTRVLPYHPGGGAFEQSGCDWHLSPNDHQRLSDGLAAVIDAHPDLWQGQ